MPSLQLIRKTCAGQRSLDKTELCKRIPLQIVYAWAASVAQLQCKGLNLTSASVIGNWTASFAYRLLLILHEGAPQPDVGLYTPFGSSQCLCHT